jgi:hypothetical protein
MKPTSMLIAGFAAGIVFVVACHRAGSPAHASPADCTAWEYAYDSAPADTDDSPVGTKSSIPINTIQIPVYDLPAGWEPVGTTNDSHVLIRRCKP